MKVMNANASGPGFTLVGVQHQLWLAIHTVCQKTTSGRPHAANIVDLVAMLPISERVRSIWPVHFRHAIFAFEEVRQCQRTEVQAVGRPWVPPSYDRPFGV